MFIMLDFLSIGTKLFLLGSSLFVLNACGGKPFDYHPGTEIPKKPGVFSKEADGLVIYDSNKKKDETGSGEIQEVGDQTSSTPSAQSSVGEERVEDYKAFQEYQEWKEWKKSGKNADEVKEFEEWREWKSYQEWKKRNDASE
jgi:hypothetical protein